MPALEERVSYLEAKMEEVGKTLVRLEALIVALDAKQDQRFLWMIGLQVGTLLTMIGGMFGIIINLIRR